LSVSKEKALSTESRSMIEADSFISKMWDCAPTEFWCAAVVYPWSGTGRKAGPVSGRSPGVDLHREGHPFFIPREKS
jgi:hypothetical protein